MALNSIIDGKPVRGIRFNAVDPSKEAELVKVTIHQMEELGIVREDGELTVIGVLLKKALFDYKNCNNTLMINNVRIGLTKDDICPTLIPEYANDRLKSVDIKYINKKAALLRLIDEYPILMQGHWLNEKRKISVEEIAKKLEMSPNNGAIFLEQYSSVQNDNYICLLHDQSVEIVDVNKKTIQEVGGGDVRYKIACMMGLGWA